ncbi:unnamed protein product [Arabis nemorensis]|uniref:Uncharacterized protein n=1 Tax=Arabis nemorensis TaxID=586526 RepID=A0A565BPL1_9BRAS|nr:unnamed protein product [Arabis nemorensis]
MVKTRYDYRTEKDEAEETKEDAHQKLVKRQILKNYYESLLSLEKSRREMQEPDLENLLDSSEQVKKLMNLRGGNIEYFTGFDDDGKKWNLSREPVERREERAPTNPELRILETAFHETVSRFGKSENGSSSREWSLRESKSRVVSLGIKLTRALIKVSLLALHTSQREKQLALKIWILLRSCKEQSALVAMNLYGRLDRSKELNAMNLELDRCAQHVRRVEKAIEDMMFRRSLRLKHKPKDFWKKMEAEINKCWGESFWKYVETTRRLKSVVASDSIVYLLCLRFKLGV